MAERQHEVCVQLERLGKMENRVETSHEQIAELWKKANENQQCMIRKLDDIRDRLGDQNKQIAVLAEARKGDQAVNRARVGALSALVALVVSVVTVVISSLLHRQR